MTQLGEDREQPGGSVGHVRDGDQPHHINDENIDHPTPIHQPVQPPYPAIDEFILKLPV